MIDVLTVGTFDIMHHGHITLFRRCINLAEGGKFIVGLNTDEFIEKYKGKPPIMTYEERYQSIMCLSMADTIIPNDQNDGSIKSLFTYRKPGMIVIGSDWLKKPYLPQIGLTTEELERQNIALCYVPYTYGISSTEIKRRINERS